MLTALNIEVHGLKCDTPKCDYRDEDAKYEDFEKYVGKPCPKCGASLLTPEDVAASKMLHAIADYANTMVASDELANAVRYQIPIEMNGTGKIELGKPKKVMP